MPCHSQELPGHSCRLQQVGTGSTSYKFKAPTLHQRRLLQPCCTALWSSHGMHSVIRKHACVLFPALSLLQVMRLTSCIESSVPITQHTFVAVDVDISRATCRTSTTAGEAVRTQLPGLLVGSVCSAASQKICTEMAITTRHAAHL